jgi:hypothetical protein
MLNSKKVAMHFQGEVIYINVYILNRVVFRLVIKLTLYKLWNHKRPTIKYFRVFGSSCYMLRDGENLYKFDNKSDEAIFIGYSSHNKAYRVYNLRTQNVIETINVVINDNLKETVINNLDDMFEATEETSSEQDEHYKERSFMHRFEQSQEK